MAAKQKLHMNHKAESSQFNYENLNWIIVNNKKARFMLQFLLMKRNKCKKKFIKKNQKN